MAISKLKMAPSTRVCNLFLPQWFRHFTKAAEEQEAKATRNRADPFWLVGLLLESGSWWLKMEFLMGAGGWTPKAEDQNSLVGLSWYLKRKNYQQKQMKVAPLSSLITPTGSSQTRKEATHCTAPTMRSLWQSLPSAAYKSWKVSHPLEHFPYRCRPVPPNTKTWF